LVNTPTGNIYPASGRTLSLNLPVTNNGTITIGAGTLSVGPLTLSDSSRLVAVVRSGTPGRLTSTSRIVLDGSLVVDTVGGYVPGAAARVEVVSAPSVSGGFESTSGMLIPGAALRWQEIVEVAAVALTATAVPVASLSIADVETVESNGSQTANVEIRLSEPAGSPVTVSWATTTTGTATPGVDFVAVAPTVVTFAPGQVSRLVPITILGDGVAEPLETGVVALSAVSSNATVGDGTGVVTIVDDDAPSVSIGDVEVVESNLASKTVTLRLRLSKPAKVPVTVKWATTAGGSATAAVDYVAVTPKSVSFAAGVTAKTVQFTVKGDSQIEVAETVNIALTQPSAGLSIDDGTAIVTIVDDDTKPTISVADASIIEGHSGTRNAILTVSLSGPYGKAVSVKWKTTNATATSPTDFTAKALTTLSFPAGTTAKTIAVAIKGERVVEPNELFYADLSAPINATISDSRGTITITNDD
jgi:chitinase